MAREGKFQVAAGTVIQNRKSGDVLMIHRASGQFLSGLWEFPIGRLKQYETFIDGLKREVAEETGIEEVEIKSPISVFELMRGEEKAENEVRAVIFVSTTSEVKVKLSKEHDEYRWLPIDEAIALADHAGIKRDLKLFKALSKNNLNQTEFK